LAPDDPIDQALAAIASIRDGNSAPLETATSDSPDDAMPTQDAAPDSERGDHDEAIVAHEVVAHEVAEHEAPATAPEPDTEPAVIEGYAQLGPGPLDAIRFRWIARRDDDGRYYVDETIGGSRPISTGPMPAHEVIGYIDAQERAARERFEALKSEMTLVRSDRPHRAHVADDEHSSSDH
jgi:hypothetical protein